MYWVWSSYLNEILDGSNIYFIPYTSLGKTLDWYHCTRSALSLIDQICKRCIPYFKHGGHHGERKRLRRRVRWNKRNMHIDYRKRNDKEKSKSHCRVDRNVASTISVLRFSHIWTSYSFATLVYGISWLLLIAPKASCYVYYIV